MLSRKTKLSVALAAGLGAVSCWNTGRLQADDSQPSDSKDVKAESQQADQEQGSDSDTAPKAVGKDIKIKKPRVIVIGPDGKRMELNGDMLELDLDTNRVHAAGENPLIQWLTASSSEVPMTPPKYVIGVGVMDVPSVVWSQLKREAQPGVVVAQLMPESPAQMAGIQENDIILKANDKAVENQMDLINVVQESVDKPVKLQLLRGGEEISVEVTPKENEIAADLERASADQEEMMNALLQRRRIHAVGPGVIWDDNGDEMELKAEVEALRSQLEDLQKAVEELKSK